MTTADSISTLFDAFGARSERRATTYVKLLACEDERDVEAAVAASIGASERLPSLKALRERITTARLERHRTEGRPRWDRRPRLAPGSCILASATELHGSWARCREDNLAAGVGDANGDTPFLLGYFAPALERAQARERGELDDPAAEARAIGTALRGDPLGELFG